MSAAKMNVCIGEGSHLLPLAVDLETEFEDLDDMFKDVDCSYLNNLISNTDPIYPTPVIDQISNLEDNVANMASTSVLNLPTLEDQLICANELGMTIFLRAELFRKEVKIHIRRYESYSNQLFPTKNGVCLDLQTWFRFCQKLFKFNLTYISASFVANNKLLVLNKDGDMLIQRMDNGQNITLWEDQFIRLQEECFDFNEKLLAFLYESYLPALIASKLSPTTHCQEESDILQIRLNKCLEAELYSSVFSEYFECEACILQECRQIHHSCKHTSPFQKFEQLGQFCLLLVNFNSIVYEFVKFTPAVSVEFLQNFNVKVICGVLFQTLKDIV